MLTLPQSPVQYLHAGVDRQAKSDRMSVSHKESFASSAQLEYTYTGQLGPANSTRVYDRPNQDRQTNLLAPTNIPGREKKGGATTSHQPEGIEPVCSGGTLQNGRFTSPSRLNPARGLDDKNGPQRCLFASANPRMFSPVCLGRETLQISMPTFWPVISTKGVYQTPETSCGLTQTDRHMVGNLFGRHAFYACKQGTNRAHGTIDSESLRGLGPYGEQSEVTSNTRTTYRILGISDQFMQSIPLLTPGKGNENTTGSIQALTLSAREMAIFIGRVSATSRALWQTPLHYRALQRSLNSVIARDASQEQALQEQSDRYTAQVLMNPELKRDLQWLAMTELWALGTAICTPSSPTLVLESDASQKGWGTRCMETSTGGLWSVTEAQHHINYLELLAAFLALKTFANYQKGLILLKMDNVLAVTYINQKGGTHSTQLCNLALQVWEWCIQKGIMLQAEHLPGNSNVVADIKSRTIRDRCDWMINPKIFQKLQQSLGPLEIDLFASRLTKQLPKYYSCWPDPRAETTDAFLQNWT